MLELLQLYFSHPVSMSIDPATMAMIASAGLQIWGQVRQSREKKRVAQINQRMFQKQQKLSAISTKRKIRSYERETQAFIGEQVSSLSKASPGGVGSAGVNKVAKTKQIAETEKELIKKQGKIESEILSIKSKQAARRAAAASESQFFGTLSTIFNTGSNILDNQETMQNNDPNFTESQRDFLSSDASSSSSAGFPDVEPRFKDFE